MRQNSYAQILSKLIQAETVSVSGQDKTKFRSFHQLLKDTFPHIFAACKFEDFDGSILLRWQSNTDRAPILLMNHHDVVEASGDWTHPPFSGAIADGKVWGRGTLDTKGGLFAMLQAADELSAAGFVPNQDVYFFSACTEECDGSGADTVSQTLVQRGIRFAMVLDEGGMILEEPISGANGTFAMVGLGEKGSANLKFIARSAGGHASAPGKDTPLVRLGKFMSAAEKSKIFKADISPVVCRMFQTVAATMDQPLKFVLGHPKLFKPALLTAIPKVSGTAGAMLKTTLAFTMASGSEGANVLPQEAWVVGNMRYSHHQGGEASIAAIQELAAKFDIETQVLSRGFTSPLSDPDSDAFRLVERAVSHAYPGVITTPYLMTAASDCRFMSRVSENCLRFVPFKISQQQLDSVHGIDENVDISTLPSAVEFYKYILSESGL